RENPWRGSRIPPRRRWVSCCVFSGVADGMASAFGGAMQPTHAHRDYSRTPVNVYWEITRACALACRHCRAEASTHADPGQLTFKEGVGLLRQILKFGEPLPQLILTGGDPLARTDLFDIVDEA